MVQLEAGHNAHGELTLFALVSSCLSPPSLLLRADHTLRLCCLAGDPGWHLLREVTLSQPSKRRWVEQWRRWCCGSFLEQLDGKLNSEVLVIQLRPRLVALSVEDEGVHTCHV